MREGRMSSVALNIRHPAIALTSVAFCTAFVLLSGCSPTRPTLPAGDITVIGELRPVPLSLSRRGTHLLSDEQGDRFYVEGGKFNLRLFDYSTVRITGVLESNADPEALPVMVVRQIRSEEEDVQQRAIDAPSLVIDLPTDWVPRPSAADATVILEQSSSIPILRIIRSTGSSLPAGQPIIVGGFTATRQDHTADIDVFVRAGNEIVRFWFTPAELSPSITQQFLRALQTVQFSQSAPSSASAFPHSASSELGAPCGGAAGVLCPSGSYCDLSAGEGDVGRCRTFTR